MYLCARVLSSLPYSRVRASAWVNVSLGSKSAIVRTRENSEMNSFVPFFDSDTSVLSDMTKSIQHYLLFSTIILSCYYSVGHYYSIRSLSVQTRTFDSVLDYLGNLDVLTLARTDGRPNSKWDYRAPGFLFLAVKRYDRKWRSMRIGSSRALSLISGELIRPEIIPGRRHAPRPGARDPWTVFRSSFRDRKSKRANFSTPAGAPRGARSPRSR